MEEKNLRPLIIRLSEANPTFNNFKDMVFTDDQGNVFKIPNKMSGMFSMIRDNPGKKVKLGIQDFNGTDYVMTVGLVDIPQPIAKQTTPLNQAAKPQQRGNPTTPHQNPPITGPEKGMILQEVGEGFRCGLFNEKDQKNLWNYYLSEISRVTGVKIN